MKTCHHKLYGLFVANKKIISIVAILACIFVNCNATAAFARSYASAPLINRAMPKPQNGFPQQYNAADNFAIAAAVINDCAAKKGFTSVTSGKIVANVFNYTQNVQNTRTVCRDKIFNQTVSLSAFASVAQRQYFENNQIIHVSAKTRGKKIISWDTPKTDITNTFTASYGAVPREITKYNVTPQSYISGELVSKNSIGSCVYKMELEPTLSKQFFKYEMMTLAGITTIPIFYKSTLTFTINSDWQIQSITYDDHYKIDMLGGIKCHSILHETFSYP